MAECAHSIGKRDKLMSSSENKALVRRWFDEVWNKGDQGAIDEMFAVHGVVHGIRGGEVRGRDEFKTFFHAFRAAFSVGRVTIEQLVAEDDIVAVRWTRSAVHTGSFEGFAATNRPVTFAGTLFLRVKNGQIVEGWSLYDEHGIVMQLDGFK
jgi:steroid delta-isomerase-like uncharacterized protein